MTHTQTFGGEYFFEKSGFFPREQKSYPECFLTKAFSLSNAMVIYLIFMLILKYWNCIIFLAIFAKNIGLPTFQGTFQSLFRHYVK